MWILGALPGSNLFSTLPTTSPPSSSPNHSSSPKPPIPIPKYPPPSKSRRHLLNPSQSKPPGDPAFKTHHQNSKYYKPIEPGQKIPLPDSDGRAIIVGNAGISYQLPGAPFEFMFSYSETPKAQPLAMREPAFLPFAPPTMPRPWTGKAPIKKSKRNIKLFEPLGGDGNEDVLVKRYEMLRDYELGKFTATPREEVLGEPLTRMEIKEMLKPCLSSNKQVNLGRDGLTHNMLELIHTHWRRQPVCKVRCLGVPTVDMDNICSCLEEKTGGKIIHRIGGVVYLFRGRNYSHSKRPQLPVMLWKPAAPVYPKLIQDAPEGLTKEEADELREKGTSLLPILKLGQVKRKYPKIDDLKAGLLIMLQRLSLYVRCLTTISDDFPCSIAKNGVYLTLVRDVRTAFEGSILVKIDCRGMHASDYKKLGAKLKELVPCVLLSFDDEQILMWRGREWKSMYHAETPMDHLSSTDSSCTSNISDAKVVKSSPKMVSLWQHAVESGNASVLDEIDLSPDVLLSLVDKFEITSQASEHSYPAMIYSNSDGSRAQLQDDLEQTRDQIDLDDYDDKWRINDSFDPLPDSVPLGLLPIDLIAKEHTDSED